MTVKEVTEMYKGQYVDIEVYEPTSFRGRDPFHTDAIRYTEEYSEDAEVTGYNLADKEEYQNSVGVNCDLGWEWEDCYEPDDKILLIKIKQGE